MLICVLFTGCTSRREKAKTFAQMALVKLIEGNEESFKLSKQFIEKACKIKPYGKAYGFLKARILLAENKEEALAQYEHSFNSEVEFMTGDDASLYMSLLADSGKYKECLKVLEYYTEHFPYFQGFGQFASSIYEQNGKYFEAVLSAFLDYEYHSCFTDENKTNAEKDEFLANIEKLEKESSGKAFENEIKNGCNCIKAFYSENITDFPEIESNFYIYRYLQKMFQIKAGTIDLQSMGNFLSLEKYFSVFPVYYWNVYLSARKLEMMQPNELIAVLEKTFSIAPSSIYAKKVRELL